MSDGAGGAYAVWRDRRNIAVTDRDLFAQRIGPDGDQLWGVDDLPVVVEPASQSGFSVRSDGNGGLFVAWADSRSGTPDIYAQHITSDGTIVGPVGGAEVCTDSAFQSGLTVVGDATGLIAAWNDYRNVSTATDIYANRVFADMIFADGFESGGLGAWSTAGGAD